MLLLSVTLASCAGIGDGALTNNRYSEPDDNTEKIELESGNIIDLPIVYVDYDRCVINVYNSEGHSTRIARPNTDQRKALRELLESADYSEGYNDVGMTSYIHVLFEADGLKEAYRIYSNDSVAYTAENMSITVRKGAKEGVYEKVREIMVAANESISRAEYLAGYSFSSLIVCADASTSFNLTDFSELDCIGIVHLMGDKKTGQTWYTFYFDSDSKERIDEIAKELKSRDDVVNVDMNYIETLH